MQKIESDSIAVFHWLFYSETRSAEEIFKNLNTESDVLDQKQTKRIWQIQQESLIYAKISEGLHSDVSIYMTVMFKKLKRKNKPTCADERDNPDSNPNNKSNMR